MRDGDIHIGDVLRVRQWDDMLKEFGSDEHGKIKSRYGFAESCKYLCGMQFVVTEIRMFALGMGYYGFIDDKRDYTYFFTPDELELIDEEELPVADDEEIKLLFE